MSEIHENWNKEEQRLVYCRLLLAEAGRFYEKHRMGQVNPFNIFSVLLQSESLEVNLHSRFLHALLDYKDQKSGIRENLKLFLEHIDVKDFVLEGETVERERFHIDILIRNDKYAAVAIENKIYAPDRDQQLQGYKETLVRHGYKNIHMVYLTLDGKFPSPESVGRLDKEEIITISYQNSPSPNKSIRPWLKDCQNLAFDNLELQVIIKQYRRIVQTLTGNSFEEAYMTDLLKLLKKDNNVQLFFHLQTVLTKELPILMRKLWEEIEKELKYEIPDLVKATNITKDNSAYHPVTPENIEKYCNKQIRDFGINFCIGRHAWFCIRVENEIYFGVACDKENFRDDYDNYYKALHESGYSENRLWPVYKYAKYKKKEMNFRYPNPEVYAMLLDDKKRQNFASKTVNQAKTLWIAIKSANLVDFNK